VRYLGVDLAWGSTATAGNETGVTALDERGTVLDAGWTVGRDATRRWIHDWAGGQCVLFIDAPLVLPNRRREPRLCEREVGRHYGRWQVSANSTNRSHIEKGNAAGVELRKMLELTGWVYDDGTCGPPVAGRTLSECYPYTTLVGIPALGFERERPRYKRQPSGMPIAEWRQRRTEGFLSIAQALAGLRGGDPPLDIMSHDRTRRLVRDPVPCDDPGYKHSEDLLDSVLCAWTAFLWHRHGTTSCQVLGREDELFDDENKRATIIAPARDEQRCPGGGLCARRQRPVRPSGTHEAG